MEVPQCLGLTRKSQALALEEFQNIDLNLHLMKFLEKSETSISSKENSKTSVNSSNKKLNSNQKSLVKTEKSFPRSQESSGDPKKISTDENEKQNCVELLSPQNFFKSKIELPSIHRTDSENIKWDIKGLSELQGTEGKLSLSIQKVDAKRKEKHEYVIREIELRIQDLNEDIEQELRKGAKELVSNVKIIKENLEHIMLAMEGKPFSNSNDKLIRRIQEIVIQLNESRLRKIDGFSEFARNLERHRSDKFKLILKKAYKEMNEIMYLMPFEIQIFFEKKVQHLNEITMSNYHYYTELQQKLKIQMGEEMRLWFQALKFNETVTKTVEKKIEIYQECPCSISEELTVGPTKKEIKEKLKTVEKVFQHFQKMSKHSKYFESQPITILFENFLESIKTAANALLNLGLIGPNGLDLDNQSIRDLSKINGINDGELKSLWSEAIHEMLETLDNNVRSFSNCAHLFDPYVNRAQEIRELFKGQLFLMLAKNDRETMQTNIDMNLLIDTLRQEVDEKSLNQRMQQIQTTILDIDNLIQGHLSEETALVDKFVQVAYSNVDILVEEMRRFVDQFEPPSGSDPRKMKKRASWMSANELKTNDHLFSKDFLHCRFLMQGADNWQFGVWHALSVAINSCKGIIKGIVDEWAGLQKKKLAGRSELKMIMNNLRVHNIEEDFRKVRLAELKMHEERFVEHQSAVRDRISALNELKRRMKEECVTYGTAECESRIKGLMSGPIMKKRQAVILINKLNLMRSEIDSKIEERHEKLKTEYFKISNYILNSHMRLLRSLKLFSEGGNFAADEAKNLAKRMVGVEKIITKELGNSQSILNDIYQNYLKSREVKLEVHLVKLNKIVEEFSFKEKIEEKLKSLHREMGKIIFDLSEEIGKLQRKMKNWTEDSYRKENLGNYDYIPSFTRCYKEILSDVNDIGQKMRYEDSLAPSENLLKRKSEISQVSLMSSVSSKGKRSGDSKSKGVRATPSLMRTKHFPLYPHQPPIDDGTFFSKLHHKNHVSFCDVQNLAKIYFGTNGHILDDNFSPQDYKGFMGSLLKKYKMHQVQIEFVWLESVVQFIDLLEHFHKILGNYYVDTLRKFFEDRYEILEEKCECVIENLKKNLKTVEDNYVSMHQLLKPLYGHPENSNLLRKVETCIDRAEEFNRQNLLNNIEPDKETIKQHCRTSEILFLDMEKVLCRLKNSTSLITLNKNLEEKLIERVKILSQEDEDQTDCDLDLRKKIQDFKSKISIPSDCVVSYSKISLNLSTVENFPQLDAEELIETNLNTYKKTAEQIDNFASKCSTTHDKYKKMWKRDLDKISSLYKIKYDSSTKGERKTD